jgi:hypothetical protein
MHEPEEEDMSLLHHYKGLFLLEVFSSGFLMRKEVYNDMHLPYDDADDAYLRRLIKRRLWASGRRQWIGKPITFVSNIQLLRAGFPDAIVVLSIRNPYGAISSTLQMHRNKLNVENEFERSLSIYRSACGLLSRSDDGEILAIKFEDYIGDRPYWISKVLQRLDGEAAAAVHDDAPLEPRETHQKDPMFVEVAKRCVREKRDLWSPIFEQLGYSL